MTDAWFTTYTGKKFYPTKCEPDDICIEDIAHSLSNTCRYNGHSKTFYSVAEHCVRLVGLVPQSIKIHALLHDAPEALTGCGDVVSMMKHHVFPVIKTLEIILLAKIYTRFELRSLTVQDSNMLSMSEDILLATEVRDLMHEDSQKQWTLVGSPLKRRIIRWSPKYAEHIYLEKFKELTEANQHE